MTHDSQTLPQHASVWVFDGHCVLCSGSVQFLLKHERDQLVHFVAIQSALGQQFALQHGVDPDDPKSFLFIENGRGLQGSDGVLALMRHIRFAGLLCAPLRLVPTAWRDAAYYWLARNRYNLFGKTSHCMLPTPEQRKRFVLPT